MFGREWALSIWGHKESYRGCKTWSYCWMPGQKMVCNDAPDGSFNCYWQANILSLSWMQHKYSSPLSQRNFATRLWYKKKRDISVKKAMILWFRGSNLDNRPRSWYEPNHFVPIFIQGNVQQPPTTTALEKNQRDGVEKRKRRKISDFFYKTTLPTIWGRKCSTC